MRAQTIPARIRWAVDVMDVGPGDNILEIGCGPGAGAELICQRLETGKLFAIDRSESGVDRTKRRCRNRLSPHGTSLPDGDFGRRPRCHHARDGLGWAT